MLKERPCKKKTSPTLLEAKRPQDAPGPSGPATSNPGTSTRNTPVLEPVCVGIATGRRDAERDKAGVGGQGSAPPPVHHGAETDPKHSLNPAQSTDGVCHSLGKMFDNACNGRAFWVRTGDAGGLGWIQWITVEDRRGEACRAISPVAAGFTPGSRGRESRKVAPSRILRHPKEAVRE